MCGSRRVQIIAGVVALAATPSLGNWGVPLEDQYPGGFDHIQVRMAPGFQFSLLTFEAFMAWPDGTPDWTGQYQWSQMFINQSRTFAAASGTNLGDHKLTFRINVSGNPDIHKPAFHYQAYNGPTRVGNFDIFYLGDVDPDPNHKDNWVIHPGTWSMDTRLYPFFFPGDANQDGAVDIADLSILASNWQGSGKVWTDADFNGDGVVNIADLSLLASNWQVGASSGPVMPLPQAMAMFDVFDGVVVPEPAGAGVLLAAGLGMLLRRRRGRRN